MTIAYWCLFIVILLPYPWVFMARLPDITLEKNRVPRITCESFSGIRQRFYWAHLNALEAIAPFSAAVIIAHNLNMNQQSLNTLAISFVALRVAHAIAYAANSGVLRTLMFIGSTTCIILIFIKAS